MPKYIIYHTYNGGTFYYTQLGGWSSILKHAHRFKTRGVADLQAGMLNPELAKRGTVAQVQEVDE